MKIIKAAQAKLLKFDHHQITEYPLPGETDINVSVAESSGEPTTCAANATSGQFSVNLVCKELVYVIEGSGKIVLPDQEISFVVGDVLMIEPGQKYYWSGKFKILTACTPAWYPEQHQLVS